MDLPDAIDYDRTGDSPIKPEPVPDSDDRARRRQPAGVRVIACIWGLAGAVLLALATVLAGTVATIPSGEYMDGAVQASEELGRLHSAVLSAGEYMDGAVQASEELGRLHSAVLSAGEYMDGAVQASEELGRLHSAVLSAGEYMDGAVQASEELGRLHSAVLSAGEYMDGAVQASEELGRLHSAVLSAGEYMDGAVPPSEVLGWIHGAAPSIGGALISLKSAAIAVLYCLASLLIVDSCGLLAGKPWARKLAAGLAVLFILIGIVPLLCAIMRKISRRWGVKIPIEAIVAGLLISTVGGIILLYLYSPHVRQYFGGERRQSQDGLRGTRL